MKLNEAIRTLAEFADSTGMKDEATVIGSAAEFAKAGKPGESAKLLVDVVATLLVEHEHQAIKA